MEFRKGIKKMDFKVGDRVKYTGTISREIIGKTGTVNHIDGCYNIQVKWDDRSYDGVYASSLTKIEDKPTNKFKVGDIIKGTKLGNSEYTITNEKMTKAKVIEIRSDDLISIQVIEFALKGWEGDFFTVNSNFFELVNDKTNFKVGDLVKVIKENGMNCPIGSICTVVKVYQEDPFMKEMLRVVPEKGQTVVLFADRFELVNDKTIIKHKWTYGELIKAQELSKQLLYKIYFEQNMSVVFYINNQDVQATLKFGLPSKSISVIAKPTKYDKFSVVIGKCVCLCKLTGTKIPDFISGSND